MSITTKSPTPRQNPRNPTNRVRRSGQPIPRTRPQPDPQALAPRTRHARQPLPTPADGRPRGHIIGHAIGEPLPASLDGRPRGHVIGHAIGERPPAPVDDRPALSVMGPPDRSPRRDLLGTSDPRFVDSLFTGSRQQCDLAADASGVAPGPAR